MKLRRILSGALAFLLAIGMFIIPASAAKYAEITILKTDKEITIDGVLTEAVWGKALYTLNEKNADETMNKVRAGANATLYARYDDKYLYVAIVSDEKGYKRAEGPDSYHMYEGESVQVATYINGTGKYDTTKTADEKYRAEVGATAAKDFKEQWGFCWFASDGHDHFTDLVKGTTFTKKDGDTVTYMLKLPWSFMTAMGKAKPKSGDSIGFSYAITNADSTNKTYNAAGISMGRSILKDKDNNAMGTAILKDETKPSTTTAGKDNIKVLYNGKEIDLKGSKPVMVSGSVLLPMRAIFEILGATVDYKNGVITAVKDSTKIVLTIGKTDATVNGKTVKLASAAQLISGSTYVPLRFVGEALNYKVDWNAASFTVTIS